MAPNSTCVRCDAEVEFQNQACAECHEAFFGDGITEFAIMNGSETPEARGAILPSYRIALEDAAETFRMYHGIEEVLEEYADYEFVFA